MVEVGQVISGKYKLLRLLGDGGMGSVYEAEHIRLGTHVAIKVLHAELSRKAGLMERFLQEARVSAQIRSPHVCQVTDVDGTADGVAFLVMELLQGEPLSNLIRREKKLTVGTACDYTLQILQALEAAHALGVVHRDLKPDNVFVTFEGGRPVLKLIDFGIAKLKRPEGSDPNTKNLTVAGMLMGTPEYMAPEQAYAADKVDVRADLYSVGVMLYEMLSGTTPVAGDDPRIVVTKVERGEVTPLVNVAPGVQPALAGFVHRAMAPRPELRFANATDMRLQLEGVMSGKRPQTSPLPAAVAGSISPAGSNPPPPLALATTAQPGEIGTGTLMGAPNDAALAQPPGGGTLNAAPIGAQVQQQMQMQGVPPPQAIPQPMYEPTRNPQQRSGGGKGLIIALALVATLLGAGAVVAYVMQTQGSGSSSSGGVVIDPTSTPTTTTATTPTTPVTPVVTTATPLTPPPPNTVTPVNPPPRPSGSVAPPRPSGSTAPSTTPSNQPPPFPTFPPFPSTFPSAFPPFPSAFPWPPPAPKSSRVPHDMPHRKRR